MDRETFLKSDRTVLPSPYRNRAWVFTVDEKFEYWGYFIRYSVDFGVDEEEFEGDPQHIKPLYGICGFIDWDEDEEDE